MNIGFWSPTPCVGTSFAALSVAGCMAAEGVKTSFVPLGYYDSTAPDAFFSKVLLQKNDLRDVGVDAILKLVVGSTADADDLMDVGYSYIDRRLTYYTPTNQASEKRFREDVMANFDNLIKSLSQTFTHNVIDIGNGANDMTLTLIKPIDILVVCLGQNRSLIEKFNKEYQIKAAQIVYCITDFEENAGCDLNQINNLLGTKVLTRKNTFVIPHTIGLKQAVNTSHIAAYIKKCQSATSEEDKKLYKALLNAYKILDK